MDAIDRTARRFATGDSDLTGTEMKARFNREAQTIAGLNHPHICVTDLICYTRTLGCKITYCCIGQA